MLCLLVAGCTRHGAQDQVEERAPSPIEPVPSEPAPAPHQSLPKSTPVSLPDPPALTVRPSKRLRHGGDVFSIAFDPAGERIATGSGDKKIRIWTREGKLVETLHGHREGVTGVAWAPDGQRLASASFDGTIKLWDPTRDQTLASRSFAGFMRAVSFDPRGGRLAVAGDLASITLFDVVDDACATVATLPDSDSQVVWDMRFDHRGDRILSLGSMRLRMWDAENLLMLWEADTDSGSAIWTAGFSFDDQLVIAPAQENPSGVVIWAAHSGERLRAYESKGAWIIPSATFSPAGQIAFGDGEGIVTLWHPLADAPSHRLHELRSNIIDVAFSPDGTLLAAGGYDNVVQLWRLRANP